MHPYILDCLINFDKLRSCSNLSLCLKKVALINPKPKQLLKTMRNPLWHPKPTRGDPDLVPDKTEFAKAVGYKLCFFPTSLVLAQDYSVDQKLNTNSLLLINSARTRPMQEMNPKLILPDS